MRHPLNYPEHVLLADLKTGLPQAVEVWYKKYFSSINKFISTKVSNSQDADELTRETFLSCLRHLPLFRGQSSIKTWMISIAQHEIADYYRKKYAKKIVHAIPFSQTLFPEPTKDLVATSSAVVDILKQLKPEYRELLLLKYVDKASVKDIAQKCNKSIKSVESDLFRARREFKLLYLTSALEVEAI